MKRGSVKKDSQHQTLTLMPVDQSLMQARRKSGTIEDGDMVCFSPSNMDAAVNLGGSVSKQGNITTQSIDRMSEHQGIKE
jgi:hypothetical protein